MTVNLLSLLLSLCTAQVNIWVSQKFSSWTGKSGLDAICNAEFQGGIAMVCTRDINATQYFSEDYNVLTREHGGKWFSTPVALAGRVISTMFGGSSTNLGTLIKDINGDDYIDEVQVSCDGNGNAIGSLACGGYYAGPSGNGCSGRSALTSAWLSSNCGTSCASGIRVYCIQTPPSAPPTEAPSNTPSRAPSLILSRAPSLMPSSVPSLIPSRAPSRPPSLIPSRAPSLIPSRAPSPIPSPAPTLIPSRAPSLIPSRAPTRVPSAGALSPAPTLVPSRAPTLLPSHAPTLLPSRTPTLTPSRIPSRAPSPPSSAMPSPPTASQMPSRVPTQTPSHAPTRTPSRTPTPAPSQCATCTATITPGSNSTNVTVGNPSNPVVITIPPDAVPNCTVNCSIIVTVTPASTGGPPTPTSGGTSVVTIDVLDGETLRDSVNLVVPIVFVIPLSADLIGCQGPISTDCAWRNKNTSLWEQSGCTSVLLPSGTQCSCNHLTDFAVLLDQSLPHPCSQANSQIPEIYYIFIVLYSLVLLYCLISICALLKVRTAKDQQNAMLLQHSLIGVVALLRMNACLTYLNVFGDSLVMTAFVACASYPLEYVLFTKLASTWAGLVHFSMLTADARWAKIRPLFFGINIVGTGLSVALFAIFVLETSFEAAVAGTCVLSALYLALAIAFNVYAGRILKELNKASSHSGNNSTPKAPGGVATKIKWVGRVSTGCFVAQAICNILALVCPPDQLAGWTAAFLLSNVGALVCLLVAYYAALMKAVIKKDYNTLERENSSRSGHLSQQGSNRAGELSELQKREKGDASL